MLKLITNGYIITVDKDFNIIRNGAVCIKDDRIIDIGSTENLVAKYKESIIIDAKGKVVMPGLINTHLHSGLIRGTAEDLPIMEWLTLKVNPKHMVVEPDDAYIASKVCYSESLLGGTTTVVDMYRHMHRCADSAVETGIRAILVPYVGDVPGFDYFESVDDNEKLFLERNGDGDGRISVWFGLEHTLYVKKDSIDRIVSLAKKYDTGIHTHAEESLEMTKMFHNKFGCSPVQYYFNLGILGPKTLLAHCCWITPYEIEILKKTGTSIAHCPVSNMKLASGIAPVVEALDAGVFVGIGSDGVKENNNLDILEEMKFAAVLQKLNHLNPKIMPAEEVIKLATIYGAKAIGMDNEIGSIEIGKKADIIILDFNKLHLSPMIFGKYENIVPNIIYSANASDVDTVIVDGIIRVQGHNFLSCDINQLISDYTRSTEDLLFRREPYIPDTIDESGIVEQMKNQN